MTFQEALKKLNIEDYGERIFHSNSHGELFHIYDYVWMAEQLKGDGKWFRPMFVACVQFAEDTWKRPESCFQHMPALMSDLAQIIKEERASNKK